MTGIVIERPGDALVTIHGPLDAARPVIRQLRATPDGPGWPVIARVEQARRQVRDAWLAAGADDVAPMTVADDQLVSRFGRAVDHPSCLGNTAALPHRVRDAIGLFNTGEYHRAHDALEAEWRAESEPVRFLWLGILQVGIAAHHRQRGNAHGTHHMLTTGRRHLRRFWPSARGIDVRALVAIADAWFAGGDDLPEMRVRLLAAD